MKSYFLIVFAIIASSSFAQDLVLSLQATIQNNPSHLDSVKVVNTENGSQFVLKNLESLSTYPVNVDKQSLDLVTQAPSLQQNKFIKVNQPGLIGLDLAKFLPATLKIYSLNGQLQYSKTNITNANIQITVPHAQVYLVLVEGKDAAFSTKVMGSQKNSAFIPNYIENYSDTYSKNESLHSATNFFYTPGDILKIVVYLGGYFADAKYIISAISQNLQFIFYHADSCMVDYEENVYPAVKIGDQMWIQQNLRSTKFMDGTPIPRAIDSVVWSTYTSSGYCWYNNDSASYARYYGALYNWFAVNTGKLCPTGWHVPTDNEWTTLVYYLGGENSAGGKLKEAGTAHWSTTSTATTNASLFTALPGGVVSTNWTFAHIGERGFWWSSTVSNLGLAWRRDIYDYYDGVLRKEGTQKSGNSIRCVKDSAPATN